MHYHVGKKGTVVDITQIDVSNFISLYLFAEVKVNSYVAIVNIHYIHLFPVTASFLLRPFVLLHAHKGVYIYTHLLRFTTK